MIHWLFLLRYPDHVPFDEGERWYLGTHVPEAKQLKGLVLYRSWRAIEVPEEMRRGTAEERPGRLRWQRLTELGFRDLDAWKEGQELRRLNAESSNSPVWTPPPYGWPGFHSETIFIGDKPEYDFLTELPLVP
jgi:hypothetical protein